MLSSRLATLLPTHFRSLGIKVTKTDRLKNATQIRTLFTLKTPTYALDEGIAPLISPKALKAHYYNFNMDYVLNANKLIMENPKFENASPLEVLKRARLDAADALLADYVGNVLNHELFWESIKPGGTGMTALVQTLFEYNFKSVDQFKLRFTRAAQGGFSNSWAFLIVKEGKLEIIVSRNGGTVFGQHNIHPLLALDLYEHSYCYDYDHNKAEYVKNFWQAVDWEALDNRIQRVPPDVW